MRNLTQSMFRFSWAMSLLGLRQITHLMASSEGRRRSQDVFDAVSHAAEEHLGERIRGVYRAGSRLQEDMWSAVFGLEGGQAPSEDQSRLDGLRAEARQRGDALS